MITTLSGLTRSASLLSAPDSELSVSRHCHFQSFNSTLPVLPRDIQWISSPRTESKPGFNSVHYWGTVPALLSPVYVKNQDASVPVYAKIHMEIMVRGKNGWSHVRLKKKNSLFVAHIWWQCLAAEPPVTVIRQKALISVCLLWFQWSKWVEMWGTVGTHKSVSTLKTATTNK